MKYCKHDWRINISAQAPIVLCHLCGASFKPQPQQLPYRGIVPEKFKVEQ